MATVFPFVRATLVPILRNATLASKDEEYSKVIHYKGQGRIPRL